MFTAVPNLQACANSWAVNLDANDIWSYWSVTYVISFTHLSPFQKRKDGHFCEDTRVGTKVWEVKYSVTRPMIKPPTQPMVAQIKALWPKTSTFPWKLTWNRVEPDVFPLVHVQVLTLVLGVLQAWGSFATWEQCWLATSKEHQYKSLSRWRIVAEKNGSHPTTGNRWLDDFPPGRPWREYHGSWLGAHLP